MSDGQRGKHVEDRLSCFSMEDPPREEGKEGGGGWRRRRRSWGSGRMREADKAKQEVRDR